MIKINTISSSGGSKTREFVVDADLFVIKKGNIVETEKEMWYVEEVINPWISWMYRQHRNLALVKGTKIKVLQSAGYTKNNGDVTLEITNNSAMADLDKDSLVHAFGQAWKVTKRTNGPATSLLEVKPIN